MKPSCRRRWRYEEGGPNVMVAFPGASDDSVRGHLYPGKPAASGTGITIHLAVAAPLEAAMERVTSAGGTVVSPVITDSGGELCLLPRSGRQQLRPVRLTPVHGRVVDDHRSGNGLRRRIAGLHGIFGLADPDGS